MIQRGQGARGWPSRGGAGGGAGGGSRWGKRGDIRHRGGGNNICRNFQTGYCRFGIDCRFSHDSTNSNEHKPSSPVHKQKEVDPEQEKARADYNAWKRLIKVPPKPNDTWTIERLWNGALAILDEEDREWKQMLPRDLDDDEYYGREHIQTLLSMVAHTHGCREFVDLAHPFLMVITHPELLDCLSVDMFVGNLYNYIGGTNGTRAIPFFKRLSTSLIEAHSESSKSSLVITLTATFNAMSIAICELLRRVPRATFNDDIPDLVNSLEKIPEITGIDRKSATFQKNINLVVELRAMIARANGLLNHEEQHLSGVSTTVIASTYPREVVLPGGRHDNDKTDITKIKLLPTEDEIRSEHKEFLPSTDLNQPHFLADPAERHLDTHFRLLRHDIFGEMKEALAGLMITIENNSDLLSSTSFSFGGIRAYYYPKSYIRYISYDHRRGLEVQISFPQLPQLRKKSPSERCTWWKESGRLEEGVLLCFLFLNGTQSSILFFTVSGKCTDSKKDFSLSSENTQSTIAAKLAALNQIDMELMTQLSCQNTRGVLIEFRGVLLATFIPILENLQNMQQLSRLPFRQWILPDKVGIKRNISLVLDIPPPLYARSINFTYSLNAILKNSDDSFALNPNTQVNDPATIDELTARTVLDRGQCQALVAGLSREFAFIQGPPGTGKSYLGVHLMKVLLSCKLKASLGPIVVV